MSRTLDLFGRTRIAAAQAILDVRHDYPPDVLLRDGESLTASGGSVTHLPNASSLLLSVTSAAGSFAGRKSLPARYQAAREVEAYIVVHLTTVPVGTTVVRWGLFDELNGIFFECTSTAINFVRRSSSTGVLVEERVRVGRPSTTLTNHIWRFSHRWLSAGPVEGWMDDRLLATLSGAGLSSEPWCGRPNLPMTVEVSSGAAGGIVSAVYTCASIISVGGDVVSTLTAQARRSGLTVTTSDPTLTPLLGIRPAALVSPGVPNRSLIRPVHLTGAASQPAVLVLLRGASLTNGAWASSVADPLVEVNSTVTTFTGGTPIASWVYENGAGLDTELGFLFHTPAEALVLSPYTNTQTTLLLAAAKLDASNPRVSASLTWATEH